MIGIISDTHENEPAIKKAVKIFKDKNVELVVHCGDIISPPMLEHFKGLKIFYVYHGTDNEKLDAEIKSNKYDYVLTGHTHVKRDERIGKTRIINPGALFRIYPYTIALLNVEEDKLEFVKIKL